MRRLGKGTAGPFPLPPTPRGQPLSPLRRTAPLTQGSRRTTPQSAAADSSPHTGEPKNNPSGAARQLPLRGAFESVRPASGGRWERGCRGSDSSPAGNVPRRGKMMCGFCAVAASPQSAAAANGEETGERCGVRRVSEANLEVVRFGEKSTVYSFRKISRPEHWNVPRGHSSAEIVKSILFAMKRQDWHGLLKN